MKDTTIAVGLAKNVFEIAILREAGKVSKQLRVSRPKLVSFFAKQERCHRASRSRRLRPVQEPWPLQVEAIEDAVTGLTNHDRGRLVMACGTGKTFTALRIAEQLVEDGQRILFAAPTIALVSQARREWLRQTTRKLECIVVCSDPTAGGRNENEDIRISELECPVSTDPAEIASSLAAEGSTRVVFCTYHSLGRVTEAQVRHGAPEFDLAIADEAHRTTGALLAGRRSDGARKVDFQEFHDDERLIFSFRPN